MKYSNKILQSFFGAYFHQDWEIVDGTPDGVVDDFLRMESEERVECVENELERLLNEISTEVVDDPSFLFGLHCYFLPGADGKTNTAWLKWLLSKTSSETKPTLRGVKQGRTRYLVPAPSTIPAMPRPPRHCPAGYVYHVLNRSAGRIALFRRPRGFVVISP